MQPNQHIKDLMLQGGLGPDVQIRFHRRGPWLVAVAHIQGAGEPIHLTAKANLEQMMRFAWKHLSKKLAKVWASIMQRVAVGGIDESAVAVGFFGFIKKAYNAVKSVVKKVANNRVFKAIHSASKAIIRSKYVGYALSAVAVIYPPVGVPAAAAFYSAQKILAAAEKGGKHLKKAEKFVGDLKKISKKPGRDGAKARKALKVLKISQKWRSGVKRARPKPRRSRLQKPSRVRGSLRLPSGQRARMFGVQKSGRLKGVVVIKRPGRRPQMAPFTARVSGDDVLDYPVPNLTDATTRVSGDDVLDYPVPNLTDARVMSIDTEAQLEPGTPWS